MPVNPIRADQPVHFAVNGVHFYRHRDNDLGNVRWVARHMESGRSINLDSEQMKAVVSRLPEEHKQAFAKAYTAAKAPFKLARELDFNMDDAPTEPASKRSRPPVDPDAYLARQQVNTNLAKSGVDRPSGVEDRPEGGQSTIYDPEQEKTLAGVTDPDGSVTLHHYTSVNGHPQTLILDPNRLGQNRWSKAEKKASSVPKTFFYTNPADQEAYFNGMPHYVSKVDAKGIYDLTADPKKIVSRIAARGMFNINQVLGILKRLKYKGVFYSGSFPTVAMLHPVRARKVEDKVQLARDHSFHFNIGEQKFTPDIGAPIHDAFEDAGQDPKMSGHLVQEQARKATLQATALSPLPWQGGFLGPYNHQAFAAAHRQVAQEGEQQLARLRNSAMAHGVNQADSQTLSDLSRRAQAHADAADAHETAEAVFAHRSQHPDLWSLPDRYWAVQRAISKAHEAYKHTNYPRSIVQRQNALHSGDKLNLRELADYYHTKAHTYGFTGSLTSDRTGAMLKPEQIEELKQVEQAWRHADAVHQALTKQKHANETTTQLARSGYGYCFECKAPFIKHDKASQTITCPNGHKRRYLGRPPKLKFAALRAPAGGTIVNNQFHVGGQILPRAFKRISRVVKEHEVRMNRSRLKLARGLTDKPEGYMAPDGTFHPLATDGMHIDLASRLFPEARKRNEDPRRHAEAAGYMHVSMLRPEGSIHGYAPKGVFTPEQVRKLRELALQHAAPEVTLDGGGQSRRIRLARIENPTDRTPETVLSPEDKAAGKTTAGKDRYEAHLTPSIHNKPGVLPTVEEIKTLARVGESTKGQYEHAGRVLSSFIGHDNAKLFTAANAILSPLAK